MPQVPTINIEKNVRFNKSYTAKTFNRKMYGFYRRDGILEGLAVSKISPSLLEVAIGAFMQTGIIVELLAEFQLPVPGLAFPWTAYAYTDDELNYSPVTIAIATTGTEPAGVVVLATSDDGDTWVAEQPISIKGIDQRITDLESQQLLRNNLLVNAGFELQNVLKGAAFLMPGPCVDGWSADNLTDKAAGSRVDLVTDLTQTRRGGACLKLTSEAYADPGASLPDGSSYPAGVYSSARIWQAIDGYEEMLGEDMTLSIWLRLPVGQANQLHDIEIALYGSSLGAPGFSDTPVDKLDYVIPAFTLTQNWQQFTLRGKIVNLNTGLAAVPLPAVPGLAVRVAYIHVDPVGTPVSTDKVLVDDCMLYQGNVETPVFFPLLREVDWVQAEGLFEGSQIDRVMLGSSSDILFALGEGETFRTKKRSVPTVSYDVLVVSEEGSGLDVNNESSYDKILEATSLEDYRLQVSKLVGGYRPTRIQTTIRAQA